MQNLVEMQTTKNKDDLYKGSFVKNSNVYHIDYGNSFTSDTNFKSCRRYTKCILLTAEKLCTYKRNDYISEETQKIFSALFHFRNLLQK